jgi:hypothetical protein
MTKIIATFLLALLTFAPNQASAEEMRFSVAPTLKNSCFGPEQAEAEQGLRIHSELMVIALNCQHMTPRGWKNFYKQYQEITVRHQSLFRGYEDILINHYTNSGKLDPERALHDLRTTLANKVSSDAARMRPDIFCATFAPRLPKVEKMSSSDLKTWAIQAKAGQRMSEPMCR